MLSPETSVEGQKRAAAERALKLVRTGMVIGLGTGSTARYFIEGLGEKVRQGFDLSAVVTSADSRRRAEACGIRLAERVDRPIDLTVDGADEISPSIDCIKGRGGALLREKIVAHSSRRFVLIADESKLVERLGRGPVPVEVLGFLWESTGAEIAALGGRPELRMAADGPFRTDNGNLVLDVRFPAVDPDLGSRLHAIPGVIEHGLFFSMAQAAIVAGVDGLRVLGELG
ncbi:MAG TPA: ribose-5-phosphate isomerase RpiA [Candidatus Dormibacteraeota bacterium]|nr:ribose-5-phosphate isomerase RpiA [Candidatus Dormibacteraeota bacterium]